MSALSQLYSRIPPNGLLSGDHPFARFLARKLLADMKATIADKTYSAKPFVEYERHFGKSQLHTERFQNYIAEEGILRDLLAVNWFQTLSQSDHKFVSALFSRVLYTVNVQRSIQNRPQFLKYTKFIETFSPSAHATSLIDHDGGFSDFDDETTIGKRKLQSVQSGDMPLRFAKVLPSEKVTKIVERINDLPADKRTRGLESKLLKLIKDAALTAENPADLPRLLSTFEFAFGGNPEHVAELAKTLNSLPDNKKPDAFWLDRIDFNDRVLISSLFRRMEGLDDQFPVWMKATGLADKIIIGNQDEVYQLSEPGLVELEEKALFEKILSGEVSRSERIFSDEDVEFMPSEESLKVSGWYNIIGNKDWHFSESIRLRDYADVIATAHDVEKLQHLSPTFRMYAAACAAFLGKPISKQTAKPFIGIPNDLIAQSGLRAAELKENAQKILFRRELASPEGSPRAYWLKLQQLVRERDPVAFDGVVAELGKIYSDMNIRHIRDRILMFDTFLIDKLPNILTRMSRERAVFGLPTQLVLAMAYCTINTGQNNLFGRLLEELKSRDNMARNLFVPLLQAYQITGLNHIDEYLANTRYDDTVIIDSLEKFKKTDRVLTLIEGPASLRSLRNIPGKPELLHCAPVQPAQVPGLPEFAEITQVDDVIPLYGEDDARLSSQLENIVKDYISGAQSVLKEEGFDDFLVDTVEIAHSALYMPAYRNLLSLHIAQQYIDKADEYDHIILIMYNGLTYGSLIKDLIEKVGKDRIHISIQNDRRDLSMSCLNEIRANFDLPKIGRERPFEANWAPHLKSWLKDTRLSYVSQGFSESTQPYAMACFEHINGYGDSYKALVNENLKHGDVEICISAANKVLQQFIDDGGFEHPPEGESPEHWGNLRQFATSARPDVATSWLPGLMKSLGGVLENTKSPLFPRWRHMFTQNLTTYLGQRLPRIFDAAMYVDARFDAGLPTHVMTGPNQHILSRAASYAAKHNNVPVYDFLILANTDHPRYRPPIADVVYLYDGWYKDIYRKFFKMKASQLRESGPLFRYSDRLKTDMTGYEKNDKLRDIILFSQSANFDSTRTMLEAICDVISDRDDVALTVKLHPHESPGNIERFTKIANEHGVKKNLTVIHHDNAVALVNKSDLVIQSFSNIGLDAFLLGKPVITYKPPTELTSRIFLYEKEIGVEVKTKAALKKAVKGQLDSVAAQKKMKAKADKFAEENAHFLRTDNAKRVVTQIHKDLAKRQKTG